MTDKYAALEAGIGRSIANGFRNAGNPISKGFRYLANVPQGQKYFSNPLTSVTRPLKTIFVPNFGPGGNAIRNSAIGYGVYQGGKELDSRLQTARNTLASNAAALPGGEKLSQEILNRTSYPALAGSAWRTLRGQGDPNDPIGTAADAIATKGIQLGLSQGLKDWSNSPYRGLDVAAGIWSPIAKRVVAGRAGTALSNAHTIKDEAADMISDAIPKASATPTPTGTTAATDMTGEGTVGSGLWSRGKDWVSKNKPKVQKGIHNLFDLNKDSAAQAAEKIPLASQASKGDTPAANLLNDPAAAQTWDQGRGLAIDQASTAGERLQNILSKKLVTPPPTVASTKK